MKLNKKRKGRRAAKGKALLLGLGLDGKDEHLRVTKGDNFRLIGGSKETHEVMQEKAIKFNEELSKRGKELEECSKSELMDIAEQVKLNSK